MRRSRFFLLGALALALGGCGVAGLQPVPTTMPAAKAGLQPEYRIFYDALEEYGDWVLIEPYGYVFRPNVNFVAWRPYAEGFWVPSDIWGWVWISAEPFGWATYHYGQWLYDRFQGWVWTPGLDWGPAWVNWQLADDYVGWAPVGPPGSDLGGAPGGWYNYVPIGQLGSTSLQTQIVSADQIASKLAVARPIRNLIERNGVTINRGPRFELVERVAGPLARVRLADVPSVGGPKKGPGAGAGSPTVEEETESARRAGEEAASQARSLVERGGSPPPRLSVIRPILVPAPARPAEAGRRAPGRGRGAAPDSGRGAAPDSAR
ncbi:MAG TPA: DUF6600 domain-containing protein [Candidatus Eisenbacteria bacterium]|jgi:hypothetical protein